MDKERYQRQVAQSITPFVSSTYSYILLLKYYAYAKNTI